jgi:hypothetical protein
VSYPSEAWEDEPDTSRGEPYARENEPDVSEDEPDAIDSNPIFREGGIFKVTLGEIERQIITGACAQFATDIGDASKSRLYPLAYPEDPSAEADYREMVDKVLKRHRYQTLAEMARSAHEPELTMEQLESWMHALETMRLLLGERIGITEDLQGPIEGEKAGAFELYRFLTWLQACVVDALAA